MTAHPATIGIEFWPLERPFAISRGVKTAAEVVTYTRSESGKIGRGECVPYARYGETTESVTQQIHALPRDLTRADLEGLLPPGAARNAVDCALWDLEAKRTGRPVWQIAGLPAPIVTTTAYTISLGTPAEMEAAAAEAVARPLLKLKLGAADPVACVEAVRRGAPTSRLIADANEGWSFEQLRDIAPHLARLGVELVEQPIPAADDHTLVGYDSPIILCADESFHTSKDVAALASRYGAVNIKLDKAGGFTEALACLHAAKAANLKIMVGCMVATSLAMAPAALLAGSADFVDLDGPLLLAKDRPDGITFVGSQMHPPNVELWG